MSCCGWAAGSCRSSTHINRAAAHSINVVHLVTLFAAAAGQQVQVGIVDGKVHVVLLEDVGGGPLDGELAQGVGGGLAVRGADHLDVVGGGEVAQLQQQDGEVVHEQQRVDQRERELHDVRVLDLVGVLQQVDAVEQPEGDHEHEDQERDRGAEHEDPRQRRLGLPEEDSPGPDQEDEELEGEADEHAVTGHVALQVESPRAGVEDAELRQDDHEDGAEEGGEGEGGRGDWAEVLAAALLQRPRRRDLPLAELLLHGVLDVRGVGHSRRGLAPVLVLTDGDIRNLTTVTQAPAAPSSCSAGSKSTFCILFLETRAQSPAGAGQGATKHGDIPCSQTRVIAGI